MWKESAEARFEAISRICLEELSKTKKKPQSGLQSSEQIFERHLLNATLQYKPLDYDMPSFTYSSV
jgi:hypothetical protein